MTTRPVIVARSRDQADLHARACGLSPAATVVITTDGTTRVPAELAPVPGDVHYAAGWELGRYAEVVLTVLRRAFARRMRDHAPPI